MATPEGNVKDDIKEVLKRFKVYYDMPVTWGMSKRGVDFHCVVRGPHSYARAFYIEAKRDGKGPTALQWEFLHNRADEQGATWFVISNHTQLANLVEWLEANERACAASNG